MIEAEDLLAGLGAALVVAATWLLFTWPAALLLSLRLSSL